MKFYSFLLATLLISLANSDFSMNSFINTIEQMCLNEILRFIKCNFGDDICIELCNLLMKSKECESYVKIYLTCPNDRGPASQRQPERGKDLENYLLSEPVQKVLLLNNIQEIVNKNIKRLLLQFDAEILKEKLNF